jgi:threonine dehydratase
LNSEPQNFASYFRNRLSCSGCAAAFAALLSQKYQPAEGDHVGVVISGGNTVAVDFTLQEKKYDQE